MTGEAWLLTKEVCIFRMESMQSSAAKLRRGPCALVCTCTIPHRDLN